MLKIKISEDFPSLPGGRYRNQGAGSGEELREDYLKPLLRTALIDQKVLTVDLDGSKYGYPPGFLEEAFGGLTRDFGIEVVDIHMHFISEDSDLLLEIADYIKNANEIRRL